MYFYFGLLLTITWVRVMSSLRFTAATIRSSSANVEEIKHSLCCKAKAKAFTVGRI